MGGDDGKRRTRKGANDEAHADVRRSESDAPMPLPEGALNRRVTMSFNAESLSLPSERPEAPREAASPDLELDTEELESPDTGPLALDLSEIDGPQDEELLDLVDQRSRPSEPELDLRAMMRECIALDDFSGALRVAELLLGRHPEDPEAVHIAGEARLRLEQIYTSRLGGLHWIPRVTVRQSDIRWLGLDPRGAFLLGCIDGTQRIEDLLDISGIPRIEALKALVQLSDIGAIEFP